MLGISTTAIIVGCNGHGSHWQPSIGKNEIRTINTGKDTSYMSNYPVDHVPIIPLINLAQSVSLHLPESRCPLSLPAPQMALRWSNCTIVSLVSSPHHKTKKRAQTLPALFDNVMQRIRNMLTSASTLLLHLMLCLSEFRAKAVYLRFVPEPTKLLEWAHECLESGAEGPFPVLNQRNPSSAPSTLSPPFLHINGTQMANTALSTENVFA